MLRGESLFRGRPVRDGHRGYACVSGTEDVKNGISDKNSFFWAYAKAIARHSRGLAIGFGMRHVRGTDECVRPFAAGESAKQQVELGSALAGDQGNLPAAFSGKAQRRHRSLILALEVRVMLESFDGPRYPVGKLFGGNLAQPEHRELHAKRCAKCCLDVVVRRPRNAKSLVGIAQPAHQRFDRIEESPVDIEQHRSKIGQ